MAESFYSRVMRWPVLAVWFVAGLGGTQALAASFGQDWRNKQALELLKATGNEKEIVLAGAGQPGALFYPGETVTILLALPDSLDARALEGLTVEAVGIHTRVAGSEDIGGVIQKGAPTLGLADTPAMRTVLKASDVQMEKGLAKLAIGLPEAYGTYALILDRGEGKRTILGTVARVLRPVARRGSIPQIMSHISLFNKAKAEDSAVALQSAGANERLGNRLVRWEFHWRQASADAPLDFASLDRVFEILSRHGVAVMNTMGAHPMWTMPMGQPTPAAGGKVDRVGARRHDAQFAHWVRELMKRYYRDGQTGLWGIEHWNEPWEPYSISGWQSDSLRYRELFKIIADARDAVAPGVKLVAAGSVMNTEDKFLSDGDDSLVRRVDIFADHYVRPVNAYGGMLAAKYGKIAGETETWGASSEVLLPQYMTQFLATGRMFISPFTPDMLMHAVDRKDGGFLMPKPLASAVSAWNAVVADRPFTKIVFREHLPWLYQFGPDEDAVFVLYGKLIPLATGDPRDVLWAQHAMGPDGVLVVQDGQKALEMLDSAGNVIKPAQEGTYRLPMTASAFFLRSGKGASAVIAAIEGGRLEGLRRVQIEPQTPAVVPPGSAVLPVKIRNLTMRELAGELRATSLLRSEDSGVATAVTLKAGEVTTLRVPLAELPAGGLPMRFGFTADGKEDVWQEVVQATVVPKATIPVDAAADAWDAIPAVQVLRPSGKNTGDLMEKVWMPFLKGSDEQLPAKRADLRLAWDDRNLYLQMVVDGDKLRRKQRLETWDQEQYFRGAADDKLCESLRPYEKFVTAPSAEKVKGKKAASQPWDPQSDPQWPAYQAFLEANPAAKEAVENNLARIYFEAKARNPQATWADASYVYARSFRADAPFDGDVLQLGFDLDPSHQRYMRTHDLKYPLDQVPGDFMAVPDTDYELSLYATDDGGSELWMLLSPGMPRVHYFPRQRMGPVRPHAVKQATHSVTHKDGKIIFRAAIAWEVLGIKEPKAGMDVGLAWRFGGVGGVEFGKDLAATKNNGLTLHPYYGQKVSNQVRWTLLP